MKYDCGTDSDTISSCGQDYDFSDIQDLDAQAQEQELFWAMEYHKGRYRQFTRKPVRKVRRFFRKVFGELRAKAKAGKARDFQAEVFRHT